MAVVGQQLRDHQAEAARSPPGKEPRHASGIDARPTPKVKAAPAALCVSNRQRTRLLRDIPTYRYTEAPAPPRTCTDTALGGKVEI